jgi:hypothetical protein
MAKKRYDQDQLTGLAPDPGILGKLGSGVLSGISTVANVLDLPGSSVRDVLAGQNPLDQWASPHRPENRTSGRDLLRGYGLVGPKNTWSNWGGGLAAEIAMDPLTYLTFGGAAVGKLGTAAKAAGIHGDEAARIFNLAKGVAPGTYGKRSARLGLTGDMIKQHAPEAWEKMQPFASNKGWNLDEMLQEPLGGTVKFWPTGTVLGTGETAKKAAEGLDYAGNTLRHFKIPGTDIRPVGDVANLFNAKAMNAANPGQMEFGARRAARKEQIAGDVRYRFAGLAGKAQKMGFDDTKKDALRQIVERPDLATPAERPFVDEIRSTWEGLPERMKQKGGKLENLNKAIYRTGSNALHAPRFLTEGLSSRTHGGPKRSVSGFTPASLNRWVWTRGSKTGTDVPSEMSKAFQANKEAGMTDPQDFIADWQGKFGGKIPDEFITDEQAKHLKKLKLPQTPDGARQAAVNYSIQKNQKAAEWIAPKDTWEAAYKDISKLSDEARSAGIWGNHPLVDAMHSVMSVRQAEGAIDDVLDYLASNFKDKAARGKFFANEPGSVTMQELLVGNPYLKKAGLGMQIGNRKAGAAREFFLRATGKDIALMKAKDAKKAISRFRKMTVNPEEAKFLLQFSDEFKAPDSVNSLIGLYDSWNNLTKAMYTSAKPSFHGRNLPSGQFNNMVAEQFSTRSLKAAFDLARGKTIEGAAQNPIVQKLAQQQGIQNLDDAAATKILADLAYAYEMTGGAGVAAPTHIQREGGMLSDVIEDIPGNAPHTVGGVVGKLSGQGTTWKPPFLGGEVRGVAGATDTTFAPVAAGEQVGNFTEHMNRFAPFYALLEQGVDPAEAAKRVNEAQVGYQSRHYTKFEQQVMQRVALFYKFFRGQVPFTLKELIEKPGGRLAQTLRAVNRSRDDDELTPDWVKETASVDINGMPFLGQPKEGGAKRYITGLGLPFEDPLQFASPSPQNIGLEALSRLNPLVKGPLEWATGQSFFQKGGPTGGRSLEDLDPALGRTLANIGGGLGLRDPDDKSPVRYPGSSFIEHILSNSPLSTILTTARTATDPRKGPVAKTVNLTTGLKLTDISPAAQDAELRRRIQKIEREMGAKTFTDTYIPKDQKAKMKPEEAIAYVRVQELRKLLGERSKARKEKK